MVNLRRGEFVKEFADVFVLSRSDHAKSPPLTPAGGTLAIVNQQGSTKSFTRHWKCSPRAA